MVSINSLINKIVNSGSTSNTELDDLRRIRLVNVGVITALVFSPILILYNWNIGNEKELLPISVYIFLSLFAFIFNINRHNQLASGMLIIGSVFISYWVVIVSTHQIAAPYFNILFGMLAMYLIKPKYLKYVMAVGAFASFLLLNAYQLESRPFTAEEYAPAIIMIMILFVLVRRYDIDYQKNANKVKQQTADIMLLNKQKHENELQIKQNELELKQKDIDTVAANNRMQLKIRENILEQLDKIKDETQSLKAIKSIKLELKSQIDTQKKLEFSEENIKEINAQFFVRLTTKHPNLSKKERELCSYIRLGLSTKEISTLTNSSENTIYVTKNRLRTKLELSENTQVDTYLVNF